jgi:hypothetical protein
MINALGGMIGPPWFVMKSVGVHRRDTTLGLQSG